MPQQGHVFFNQEFGPVPGSSDWSVVGLVLYRIRPHAVKMRDGIGSGLRAAWGDCATPTTLPSVAALVM